MKSIFNGLLLRFVFLISVLMLSDSSWARTLDTWFPLIVDHWTPAMGHKQNRETILYSPLDKISKPWKVCVSFPHIKDNYWLSVNFGIVEEIKRLGASMAFFQAGGYDNLHKQIAQVEKCVADGADGVILGAISYDGLNNLVNHLESGNIPVVDAVNSISSPLVSAKSLVSFEEMAFKVGKYLKEITNTELPEVLTAWFPGPKNAGWVNDGDRGFRKAIADSNIKVVSVKYGDTGLDVQRKLIQEALAEFPDIEYIVGTAVTAEAAIQLLRKEHKKPVKVLAYYLTPGVYRAIKRGQVLAAPSDSAVIQGRVAVDQLVRILEERPYFKHVGPKIKMLDKQNINFFNKKNSFAPQGYNTVYSVEPVGVH